MLPCHTDIVSSKKTNTHRWLSTSNSDHEESFKRLICTPKFIIKVSKEDNQKILRLKATVVKFCHQKRSINVDLRNIVLFVIKGLWTNEGYYTVIENLSVQLEAPTTEIDMYDVRLNVY